MTEEYNNTHLAPGLYLIPVTLGETPLSQVLPEYNTPIIKSIRHFIVEEVRTARRFLKSVDKSIDIDSLHFYPMGKHADLSLFRQYLEPLKQGEPMGVISEAGCPAVADPGSYVVALAHEMNIKVIPLVGPSSIILSLMASGFNGQQFAFHGYLPIDASARAAKIRRMEEVSRLDHQTQIFIETPFRNRQLMEDLLKTCKNSTRLCVAAGITCPNEYIRTATIKQWKVEHWPDLRKVPAVFLLFA